jgi:hypothetical protein
MSQVDSESHGRIDRRAFVARLLQGCPDALVVTGLGSPSYDAFAAGDRDTCFYLWGAMGGATPMGLGLALAQPARPIVVAGLAIKLFVTDFDNSPLRSLTSIGIVSIVMACLLALAEQLGRRRRLLQRRRRATAPVP